MGSRRRECTLLPLFNQNLQLLSNVMCLVLSAIKSGRDSFPTVAVLSVLVTNLNKDIVDDSDRHNERHLSQLDKTRSIFASAIEPVDG